MCVCVCVCVCSLAFITRHENRILSALHYIATYGCPPLPYFPHYLTNGTTFGTKKLIEHKTCILIFTTTFV
jgi:hypothetical protein